MLSFIVALVWSVMISSDDPIQAIAQMQPKQLHAVASEDSSVKLFLGPAKQGMFQRVMLQSGQRSAQYAWTGSAQPTAEPQLYLEDVTGDGQPEIIAILTQISGTGVEVQQIHVVDPHTMMEYPVERAQEAIEQRVQTQVNVGEVTVQWDIEIDGQNYSSTRNRSDFYADPSLFSDTINFHSYQIYSTSPQKLTLHASGYIFPSEYVADLEIDYDYVDGGFQVGLIRLVP